MSKLIESLNKVHSAGRILAWLWISESKGRFLKDGFDSQIAECPSFLVLSQPGHNHTVSGLLGSSTVGTTEGRASIHLGCWLLCLREHPPLG